MNISSMCLGYGNIGVFIEHRGGPGAPEVGTTHQGTPGPPRMPWWAVLPLGHPHAQPGPIMFLVVHKKSL